ncbi:hypothetical protein GCM10029978_036140 [Actinoallomurus acanthiterrae]
MDTPAASTTAYNCCMVRTWRSHATGTEPYSAARARSAAIISGRLRRRSVQAPRQPDEEEGQRAEGRQQADLPR